MLGDNGEKREFRRGDLDARFTGVACVAIGVVSFGESPSSSGKAGMPTTVVGVQKAESANCDADMVRASER
jgi:hypothetical protein